MSQRTYFSHLWAELTRPKPLLRSAYLLYGPEEYLTKKAVDRLVELCGSVRPLDFAELSGAEASLAEVADEISTLPMVAERRLVIVRHAEKLLAKAVRGGALTPEADHLRAMLSRPEASWCLVCVATPSVTLPGMPGGALLKVFACYGAYPLAERQVVQWVKREADRRALRMREDAVARLVALTGASLMDLEHELDKLVAYAGTEARVTRAMVEEVADETAASLPDLLDATAARDIPRALKALDAVLLLPRNAARIIPALISLFEEIRLAISGSQEEIAKAVPAWRLAEVTSRAKGWSAAQAVEALDELFAAELALKSGVARLDGALTQFLVNLSASGTADASGGMLGRH